ncbi:hypothetical protein G7046_g5956 [Stylonectria norvegica]|nr:hypothetical protein G7046_g5956 [Stylonectria norvegica]
MASPQGASSSPPFGHASELDDIGDSDSGSSYIGSDIGSDQREHSPERCPWRTAEFHDQECSHFFDCPSHIVERSHSTNPSVNELDQDDDDTDHEAPLSVGSPMGSELSHDGRRRSNPTVNLAEEPGPPNHDEPPGFDPGADEASQHDASPAAIVSDTPRSSSAPVETPFDAANPTTSIQRLRDVLSATQPPSAREDFNSNSRQRSSSQPQPQQASPTPPEELPEGAVERSLRGLPDPPRRTSPPLSRARMDAPLPSPGAEGISRQSLSPQPQLQQEQTVRRVSSDFLLPRWQPDAEVTYCPICHTQFSFFVRKHHCRKCGRVVCNSCSPHRIIIPYQYIVRPAGSEAAMPQSLLADGLASGYFDVNGMSGGERVRLCNPCVPDPNTAPPQSPSSSVAARSTHQRSRSSIGNAYGAAPATNRHGAVFAPGAANEYRYLSPRSRSITMSPTSSVTAHGSASRRRSGAHQSPFERLLSGSMGSSSSSHPGGRDITGAIASDTASSSRQRALPPTPQIAEEDECPICHRELPSQSLPDAEDLREAHITTCIQQHSTYGTPRNDTGVASPPVAPRRTGMYTYPATEKDCIDDAECTICLEEFTVGVPMARLECLCRFHRSCISAWFVNHPGRCPVHQHDGFGY